MSGVMTFRLGRNATGAAAVVNEADGVVTILQRTSAQSVSLNSWQAVTWSSAITDSLAAWSSGAPTLITVPSGKTGVEVTVHTAWADTSSGNRAARLYINSTIVEAHYSGAGFDRCPDTYVTRRLTVTPGDTMKLEVFQSAVQPLNFWDSANAAMTPTLEFKWFA